MCIYQALIESSEDTVVPCSQLKDAFDELCRDKKLSKQFQVCCFVIVIVQSNNGYTAYKMIKTRRSKTQSGVCLRKNIQRWFVAVAFGE